MTTIDPHTLTGAYAVGGVLLIAIGVITRFSMGSIKRRAVSRTHAPMTRDLRQASKNQDRGRSSSVSIISNLKRSDHAMRGRHSS